MNVNLLSFTFTHQTPNDYSNASINDANSNKHNFDNLLKRQMNNNDIVHSKTSLINKDKNIAKNTQNSPNKLVVIRDFEHYLNNREIPKEEQIIEDISQKTDLSKDKIIETLNDMGMSVYDLLLPDNVNIFIQKILNVTDSIDLLSIPNINQLYKDIIGIMDDLKTNYPTMENYYYAKLRDEMYGYIGNENQELSFTLVSVENENANVLNNDEILQQMNDEDKATHHNQNLLEDDSNNSSEKDDSFSFEFKNNSNSKTKKASSSKIHLSDALVKESSIQNGGEIPLEDKNLLLQQNIESHFQKTDGLFLEQANNPVNPENLIEQMVEHIKITIDDSSAEMNLQLKPDHLGKLSLKIITERGIVTAQFMAESQTVKEIIEANFNQLKDVLQEQGLKVQNLEVFIKQEFNNNQSNFMHSKSSKSNKRIKHIISDTMNDTDEMYLDEVNNPYKRSESVIDFSA